MTIGIVGLGLIGGSIARALSEKASHTVLGFDIDKSTVLAAKLVNAINGELNEKNASECDIIFIALYPDATVEFVENFAKVFKKDAIVVDCGGVKEEICKKCDKIAKENGFEFIGGHPMAGTQYSGFSRSKANLFSGATMVLTPREDIDIHILSKLRQVLDEIGFGSVNVTTPAEHDKVIAFTSQLPHIISNAYVKSPQALSQKGFSAGSYKDLTRVSRLNEEMWTELFLKNKENLVFEIDFLIENLKKYSDALKNEDRETLETLLREGTDSKNQAR